MKIATYPKIIILFLLASPMAIWAQVSNSNAPHPSAALDISASNKGLLIPRIILTSTTVATPVVNPAQSLLVYNTNTIAGGVQPGYYYWEATPGAWIPLTTATTNSLGSSANTITHTINGITGTTSSITAHTLVAPGGILKSTVNGVASAEIDLNTYGKTYTALNPAVTNATVPLAFTGTQITLHSRSPLWNANQLLGRNLAATPVPAAGNVLSYNGTAWSPAPPLPLWRFSGNTATTADFIGTTNDTPFAIRTGTINTEKLRVTKEGFVGIGNTAPTAPLQFGTASGKRIVLYDTNGNNHQYYGLSMVSNMFQYQINSATSSFVWSAGKSATESTELMRLTGAGKLGIGMLPTTMLDVKFNAAQGYISRMYNTEVAPAPNKILSTYFRSNTITTDLQGVWLGMESNHGLALMTSDHDKMIITAAGNVGIATNNVPSAKLDINGTVRIRTLGTGVATDNIVTTDASGNLRKRAASTVGKTYTEATGVSSGTDAFVVNNTANTLQVNHAAAVWNASQLRGKAISSTLPNINGQVLTYTGSQWAPQSPSMNNSFKIVTGYVKVNASGTVDSTVGVGFTASGSGGVYTISYSSAFPNLPAVTANVVQDAGNLSTLYNCKVSNSGTNTVRVTTGNASGNAEGRSFNFMAVLQQ